MAVDGLRRQKQSAGQVMYGKNDVTVYLINYDGLKDLAIANALIQANFEIIGVDESTKIKDPSTDRAKWLWAIGAKIKYKNILTGFPSTEGLHELYSQIKFLDNGNALGRSYWGFTNKLFSKQGMKLIPHKTASKWITDRIKAFCIRVTNDILKLPPAVYKEIRVPKTEKQKYILDQLEKYYAVNVGKVNIDTPYVLTLIQKELQICDGFIYGDDKQVEVLDTNKDEILIDTLQEIDVRQHKVIIWALFDFTLKKLNTLLVKLKRELGTYPLLIQGDTKDIGQVVTQFRYSKTCNILIASLKKAHESITLTECRHNIYYGNYWSYDIRANSEARTRRKGSEGHESIMYIDLLTQGSREMDVYNALRQKKNVVNELKRIFKEKMSQTND